MTREEINKEIIFADMVLGVIKNVKMPMLMYDEEKEVVKKALNEYKNKLESELKGHGAEWVDNKCSACEKGIDDLIDSREWYENEKPSYCPFCGTKFKVEDKEND